MTLFELVLGGLATYRLSRLVVMDDITYPIRERIWRKFSPDETKFGYFFTCMWCFSIWTALLLVISSIIIPTITLWVEAVLAFSAIAGLLTAYEEK